MQIAAATAAAYNCHIPLDCFNLICFKSAMPLITFGGELERERYSWDKISHMPGKWKTDLLG